MSSNKKRSQKAEEDSSPRKGRDGSVEKEPELAEELVFEDPFEDEFEEEEFDEEEENLDDDDEPNPSKTLSEPVDETSKAPKQVWRPGIDQLAEGESLEYDPSAYMMYHSLRTEWPCLTFDILRDNLGDGRHRFPLTMYLACGSQADRADKNKITLLKLSDLHKTHISNDSDSEDSDDDDGEAEGEDPVLIHVDVPHQGGVNRLRSMPQRPGVVASMADTGHVHLFDLTRPFTSLQQSASSSIAPAPTGPLFTFRGHRSEGYGLDWSSVVEGRLATGDGHGAIHLWNASEGGSWAVEPSPRLGHTSSIEDIQWSPSEGTVFASCSADKSIRIWDSRGKAGPQISVDDAHSSDVNVLSWNRMVGYLLASGSDDGSFKVWDLRAIRTKSTLAYFQFHKAPVTSIEWAPQDESMLSLSSADDQLSIWDLSVEADEPTPSSSSSSSSSDPLSAFPPQLLFIHQGQHNVKELHHHPQIPGVIVSTAEDSFNVFKPAISASTA